MLSSTASTLAHLLPHLREAPTAVSLPLALHLAQAIQNYHQQYPLHGDLHPHDIHIQRQPNPTSDPPQFTLRPPDPTAQIDIISQLPYLAPEQTGLLNRPLDQRTDLYTLGLLLYQLFTGQHPFPLDAPLSLMHAQLATPPLPPHQLRPTLPLPLSALVLKLLAKEPAERYQTASGVVADLAHCWAEWQNEENIAPFALAQNDISARLLLPSQRYGQEGVSAELQEVMGREGGQLVCLWGEAGLGKSTLLAALPTLVQEREQERLWLMHQLPHTAVNNPYTAVTALLQSFVRHLLTRPPAEIAHWQTQLTSVLIGNLAQLQQHIPELSQLLALPAEQHIEATDPQLLLRMACRNMLTLLAKQAEPVGLILDDAHHADHASLQLLADLLPAPNSSLLILLAARPTDSLADWLANKQREIPTAVVELTLTPFSLTHSTQFVADTLSTTPPSVAPLALRLHQKTNGNPFFLRQLLQSLADLRLLFFDPQTRRWQWDLAQIETAPLADNVITLVQSRLELLPPEMQEMLKVAALLGQRFELDLLTQACAQSWGTTAQRVWQARTVGLLQPLPPTAVSPSFSFSFSFLSSTVAEHPPDERARAFQQMIDVYLPESPAATNSDSTTPPTAGATLYQFTHAQVREAAQQLLPHQDMPLFQWQIGWRLWQTMSADQRQSQLFLLVRHLNQPDAIPHLSAEERTAVADINAQAGQTALALIAYDNALAFAQYGLRLLDHSHDPATHHPDLRRRLYLTAAQAAARLGQFALAHECLDHIMPEPDSPMPHTHTAVVVIQERMLVYYLQGKLANTAVVALAALRQLGVRLPPQPSRLRLGLAWLRTQADLGRNPPARLANLPPMRDPTSQQAMEIMATATISLASVNPNLLMLMGMEMVRLTLKKGTHPLSPIGYAIYAVWLCAATGQIEQGYALGQLALRHAAQLKKKEYRVFISFFVHAHVAHWRDHIQDTLQPLRDLSSTGEFEYLAVAAGLYPYFSWFIAELDVATNERAIGENMHLLASFAGTPLHYRYQMGQQYYQNLLGRAAKPHELVGEVYSARQNWAHHLAENDQTTLFYVVVHELTLGYLFGAYEEALKAATLADQYQMGGVGTPLIPLLVFYESLAYLAVTPPAWQKRVGRNLRQLRRWAKHSPANHAHRVSLVAAEQARVAGEHGRARELYDTAVSQALAQDYLPELPLAHELTAHFYLSLDQPAYATHHLRQAIHHYRRWGATGKVTQLEEAHPDLLPPVPVDASGNFTSLAAYLDMTTVLNAAQLLASETVLPALLDKLMRILLENAGAQGGGLFLPQDRLWQLAHFQPEEMAERTAVALPFVWQVAQSHEPLRQTNESPISPYTSPRPPRSLLTLPLLDQGELVGVVYLENQLTRHAFPPERLPLLMALAGQAAIAIKNATLVTGLREAQAQIRASEQRFRTLFDHAPFALFQLDVTNDPPCIRAANQEAEAMYGWSAAEFATLDPMQLVPTDHHAEMQQLITAVCQGQSARRQSQHQRRDGSHFPVRLIATPAQTEESSTGQMILAVEDITAQQQRQSELQAIENERQRIAQEIHDGVAQDLAFLRLKFSLWRHGIEHDPAQVQTELTQTQAIIDQTLEELRRAIYALRPLALESVGFLPALRRYVADFNEQQKVYVSLQIGVMPEQIPEAYELVLFRVVQEGLNNIAQHAQASLAWVLLEQTAEGLVLTVRDNGRGFDTKTAETPHNGHLGLIQMRERVEQAGGQFYIASRASHGTEIQVTNLSRH